jgi:hypothetical protein
MNIFEDLVDELKEENLLEETVYDTMAIDVRTGAGPYNLPADDQPTEVDTSAGDVKSAVSAGPPVRTARQAALHSSAKEDRDSLSDKILEGAHKKEKVSELEYYRHRATDEVSSLQMVEHVVSGVEREQMKIMPKQYDDLAVKIALHDFLQVASETPGPEHAKAEFKLMQETESWCSALSHRDHRVSVGDLRRYCETTKPTLSSQALVSLARFYRNLPFSEAARAKFDMVVTRLFTQDTPDDKRQLIFNHDELKEHLRELYADWSSIPLYNSEDDSTVLLAALKFEDFMSEADSAEALPDLIRSDFFNRLRLFKESTGENFYSPLVTATAIECNVKIGNRFVALIQIEKEKSDVAALEDKYGFAHDQSISDAASKTLQLVELLKEKTAVDRGAAPEIIEVDYATPGETPRGAAQQERSGRRFFINPWLAAVTVLTLLVTFGLYLYVDVFSSSGKTPPGVEKVELDSTMLKEYLTTARVADERFIGIVQSNWTGMSAEKKDELLRKILAYGENKGFREVILINQKGQSVGYAAKDLVEVTNP